MDEIKKIEASLKIPAISPKFAEMMDEKDALSSFRSEFNVPLARDVIKKAAEKLSEAEITNLIKGVDNEKECVYMLGNSLGLQPKKAVTRVEELMTSWGKLCGLMLPEYIPGDEPLREFMQNVVGAKSGEVVLMNTLTVNLNLGMITFYQPKGSRNKILIEPKSFPSDFYTFESHIKLHGLDPENTLLIMEPREGEDTLRPEDILATIEREGDNIALIMMGGVQYYTGQIFDMEKITKAGHDKGCYVGFNLAHAAGNIPLELHNWRVDVACWCTYKYMNGGPGCIGGFFVHERHAECFEFPRLNGWWGHEPDTRFLMDNKLVLQKGAPGFALSNPEMLGIACLSASLDIFQRAGMTEIRNKSILLTGYLEYLLIEGFSDDPKFKGVLEIITPREVEQRGAQLSIKCIHSKAIKTDLKLRGIAVDYRHPDVFRAAPAPLYTRFIDVLEFYFAVKDVISKELETKIL